MSSFLQDIRLTSSFLESRKAASVVVLSHINKSAKCFNSLPLTTFSDFSDAILTVLTGGSDGEHVQNKAHSALTKARDGGGVKRNPCAEDSLHDPYLAASELTEESVWGWLFMPCYQSKIMQIKKEQPAYLLKGVLSKERKADYTKSSGKARIREGSFCRRWFVGKKKKVSAIKIMLRHLEVC